jgi:hypothetical protein
VANETPNAAVLHVAVVDRQSDVFRSGREYGDYSALRKFPRPPGLYNFVVPLTVVYDANVFYPAPLRDLLIRLAQTPLVRARWTDQILDECFDNLARNRPDLKPSRLQRTRRLINEAVRDGLVTGHDSLIESLILPDPGDRHVLAAAIHAGAQCILTFNIQHFRGVALSEYEIEALHPDRFLLRLVEFDEPTVLRVLSEQEAALRQAEPLDIVARLERQGLPATAAALRTARRRC